MIKGFPVPMPVNPIPLVTKPFLAFLEAKDWRCRLQAEPQGLLSSIVPLTRDDYKLAVVTVHYQSWHFRSMLRKEDAQQNYTKCLWHDTSILDETLRTVISMKKITKTVAKNITCSSRFLCLMRLKNWASECTYSEGIIDESPADP